MVCREIVVFFVDDGLVGLRDPIWLQGALDILVTLFESINLRTHSDKTKVVTCVSGKIQVALADKVYHTHQLNQPTPPQSIIGWSGTSVVRA